MIPKNEYFLILGTAHGGKARSHRRNDRRIESDNSRSGWSSVSFEIVHLDPGASTALEQGIKSIASALFQLPRRLDDYPDRDRLALRFEQFKRSE
jgi:hypothetical protein